MDLFKDILPSIFHSKVDVLADERDEKTYSSFMVNRALSLQNDCIFQAQEMNRNYHLPVRLQYNYLMGNIRPKKRWAQWPKKNQKDGDIIAIVKYFSCSEKQAFEYMNVLTEEQLEHIRKEVENISKS